MVNEILQDFYTVQEQALVTFLKIILLATAAVLTMIFLNYVWQQRKIPLKKGSKRTAKGFIFGKSMGKLVYSPICDTQYPHIFGVGKTGCGKTTALLLSSLESITKSNMGNAFVLDISGDIEKNISCKNKIVYDVTNGSSIPYNIFFPIDEYKNNETKVNELLENLAIMLLPDIGVKSDAALYFLKGGRCILTAALIHYYWQGLDFIEICQKIVRNSFKTILNEIEQGGCVAAKNFTNSLKGNSDNNISGCYDSAAAAVKLFGTNASLSQNIRRTNGDCYTPTALETNNAFIVIPDNKLELYAPLLAIITAQTMDYIADRENYKNPTIYLMLDEFPTLRLDILQALRLYRKKNCRICVFVQSYHDLLDIFGEQKALALYSNFAYKIILSADTPQAQEFFAKSIGNTETSRKARNSQQKQLIDDEKVKFAVQPAELGKLDNELILIHPTGWVRLKKNYFFS